MPKTYNETRYNYTYIDEKGATEDRENVKESVFEKHKKELETAKLPEPQVTKAQSFTYHEAETLADIPSLIPDEAVAVDIFNRGAVLKQQSEIRGFMLDANEAATEGAYDLQEALASKTERRVADPRSKAIKALAGLSKEDLLAVLAQFEAPVAA